MRHLFLEFLYHVSAKAYTLIFKRKKRKWDITTLQLSELPPNSLGNDLYQFLSQNNLKIQPKLESHDIYHVLTLTPIDVPSEIALQFYIRGNGKKSTYNFYTMLIGTFVLPEKIPFFIRSYRKGCSCKAFHKVNWEEKLHIKTSEIRKQFMIVRI